MRRMAIAFRDSGCAVARCSPRVLATPAVTAEDRQRVLSILNYEHYLAPGTIAGFERQTGAKVVQTVFDANIDRDNTLRTSAPGSFDLVVFSNDEVEVRRRAGLLGRIDAEDVANFRYIEPRWSEAFPDIDQHCAPYLWGGAGIAYRADLVGRPPRRWADLFSPRDAWRGRIAMTRDARELFGAALKSLGESVNAGELDVLQRAASRIAEQRSAIRQYRYVKLSEASELISGEVMLAFMFNGDAAYLGELDARIEFVYPVEGGTLWMDFLCLMRGSAEQDLAVRFLNYLNEPEVAARNAEAVRYATANGAAMALTSQAYRDSHMVFPPAASLERSEFIERLPARAARVVNERLAVLLGDER